MLNSIQEANESIRQEMVKEMEQRSQECKDENINVQVKVEMGNAAEKILNIVQNENVDLVVMAKRRKLKGVKKLLSLGSVSRKVVENVSCPVTLIDVEKI